MTKIMNFGIKFNWLYYISVLIIIIIFRSNGRWTNSVCIAVCKGPQERGSLRNLQTCNPHDTPVMYTPAGCELCSGQCMSVTGRQSSLYERLPIEKCSQLGPYAGPYYTKTHNQRDSKHQGGSRSRPNPLAGHPPGRLSPRSTGILAQSPHDRSRVKCLTGAWRLLARTGKACHTAPIVRTLGENAGTSG